ncbi:tetratricopeptide repeat protein [Membranihabitans marinus]|uniref:tetratricopeptide repeat protein n=1 Tax=Membranihabitans marinus TaxID=1227546 RepID=UPI001F2F08B4|nr:hypothetical protein [Membranihabitans marinus]
MEITEKELDLIDRYLSDALSDSDKIYFAELENDLDFKSALKQRKDLVEGIHAQGREILKAEFKSWVIDSGKRKKYFTISWSFAAAVAALLIGFFYFNSSPHLDLSKYDSPFVDIISEQKRTIQNDQSPYAELMKAYNAKDWGLAANELTNFYRENPDEIHVLMYAGIASYHNEMYEESIVLFKELNNKSKDSTSNEVAEWFLILSYIQEDQFEMAKDLLRDLSKTNHYKKDQALQLLKELN